MEIFKKMVVTIGVVLGIAPCIYSDSYESAYARLFINNKTDYEVVVHFYSEDYEQQQYPMAPNEHRFVILKEGVMRRLFAIHVTMRHPKTGKKIEKIIDYEQNADITRLRIVMKADFELELSWGYKSDKREDKNQVNEVLF